MKKVINTAYAFSHKRGNSGTIYVRLAATTICMRLAATRVQFICDCRPLGYNLYATGRQLHALAASCMQSRQFFASTLREKLFELKYEDDIKKSENLRDR